MKVSNLLIWRRGFRLVWLSKQNRSECFNIFCFFFFIIWLLKAYVSHLQFDVSTMPLLMLLYTLQNTEHTTIWKCIREAIKDFSSAHTSCLSFSTVGSADSSHLPAHRNPWRHRAASRPHLLQHLPGEQEPHQPDHGEGHAHADAQRHLRTHGEPSSTFKCSRNTKSPYCCVYVKTQHLSWITVSKIALVEASFKLKWVKEIYS